MRNCNAIPGRTIQNELLGMSLDPKSQHRPHPKMGGLAGDFTPKMDHPKVYLTEVHLWMAPPRGVPDFFVYLGEPLGAGGAPEICQFN